MCHAKGNATRRESRVYFAHFVSFRKYKDYSQYRWQVFSLLFPLRMRRSYKFLCRFSDSNICIPNNPRKSATWFTTTSCFYDSTAFDVIKVPMKRIFLLSYSKELSKWWLFYCDSTLGCRVIRDVGLCKLDHLWRDNVDTKWWRITKNWISLRTFFCIGLKLQVVSV